MIRIAICEDNQNDITNIKELLVKYSDEYNLSFQINTYNSGEEFLKHFGKQYDLIVLDVEMKKLNGIETAKKVRLIDTQVVILFATGHKNYAYESYKTNASDYLHKPIRYDDLCSSMKKVLKDIECRKKELIINFNNDTRFVELGNILYIEYFKHKIRYYFINGEVLETNGSLKEVLKQDIIGTLLLINKNCIVNIIWIEVCERQTIQLKGICRVFEVSRPKRRMIEEKYLRFCRERLL